MERSQHPISGLIGASVGMGGTNRPADVRVVQHLLNRSGAVRHQLAEDGIAGPDTIGQIRGYQLHQLHFRLPDGRIDPNGRTLRSLLERIALRGRAGQAAPAVNAPTPSQGGRSAPPAASTQQRTDRAVAAALPAAHQGAANAQQIRAPGAGGKLTAQDFAAAATRLRPGIEPALVHAIADAESGGRSGFGASGLPVIAYEGHIFRRYTKHIYDRSHPLLSYPYVVKAGPEWRKNNADQTRAWATLTEAEALDHKAALMACSWGMFQVMGFNFDGCGYATVDAFVAAMKAGERGQIDAFVGYCKGRAGMIAAMQRKDFAAIARSYNGKDYGDYDRRISRAYARHKG